MRSGASGQHWLSNSGRDNQQQRFAFGEAEPIGMTGIGARSAGLGDDNGPVPTRPRGLRARCSTARAAAVAAVAERGDGRSWKGRLPAYRHRRASNIARLQGSGFLPVVTF
jgi:hypothetical protein